MYSVLCIAAGAVGSVDSGISSLNQAEGERLPVLGDGSDLPREPSCGDSPLLKPTPVRCVAKDLLVPLSPINSLDDTTPRGLWRWNVLACSISPCTYLGGVEFS